MDVWLDRDKICGGAHGALFLMDFVTNVASSMIWAFLLYDGPTARE